LRDIAAACAHARVALRVVVMHRDPIDATASRVRQQAMVGAALLQAQLVRDNLIVLASELAEVVILQRTSPPCRHAIRRAHLPTPSSSEVPPSFRFRLGAPVPPRQARGWPSALARRAATEATTHKAPQGPRLACLVDHGT